MNYLTVTQQQGESRKRNTGTRTIKRLPAETEVSTTKRVEMFISDSIFTP